MAGFHRILRGSVPLEAGNPTLSAEVLPGWGAVKDFQKVWTLLLFFTILAMGQWYSSCFLVCLMI